MRKHTTITVRGDEDFVRACKALAARLDIKIGDFVRDALDEKYGSELNDLAVFFVATPDRPIERSNERQSSIDVTAQENRR